MFSTKNFKIIGLAASVPSGIDFISNYQNDWGSENIEKFTKMTGIKERRLANSTISKKTITASDLCFDAAERLISKLEVDRKSIDAIIFLSQYPDYGGSPATACVLQHRLSLKNEIMAFDVNQGCTGYIYGLSIAAGLLKLDGVNRVLMLNGDAHHKVNTNDKSQSLLFGDAGIATIIDYGTENEIMDFRIETKGDGYKSLIIPGGGARHRNCTNQIIDYGDGVKRTLNDAHMDGVDVFNFTIKDVPRIINEYCEEKMINIDCFDYYVFHQANKFIIDKICVKLKIDNQRVLFSLGEYGNTSSGSIPLTLAHNYHLNRIKSEAANILICGFGVGLSLAVSSINIKDIVILPIGDVSEGFDDGIN